MKTRSESLDGQIKVHVRSLFEEILGNHETQTLRLPLKILDDLLRQVAGRASELHDEKLDALMMRLALYSVADPYSPDYDQKVVDKYLVFTETSEAKKQ